MGSMVSMTGEAVQFDSQPSFRPCISKRAEKLSGNRSCLYSELSSLGAGWGGRDRTSEWRNQNPLPYRLATTQQAEQKRADDAPCANRFGQRSVYRGSSAISTGWKPEFRPKSAPRK